MTLTLPLRPILVAGTNSWNNDDRVDWYCPGHPFEAFLTSQGHPPVFHRGEKPFIWSTALDGVPTLDGRNKFVDWGAGGAALMYYVESRVRMPAHETAIIAHSHALQVVICACADQGLKVRSLITVGSPVRHDMMELAKLARLNITYWLHLHSDSSDRWQWLGEAFDGYWGIVRRHPLADKNIAVPKVGHSELLRDPTLYRLWTEGRWLDALTIGDVVA